MGVDSSLNQNHPQVVHQKSRSLAAIHEAEVDEADEELADAEPQEVEAEEEIGAEEEVAEEVAGEVVLVLDAADLEVVADLRFQDLFDHGAHSG